MYKGGGTAHNKESTYSIIHRIWGGKIEVPAELKDRGFGNVG
jgi:hypothetical protein